MNSTQSPWQRAISSGLTSVRATWPPMLLIQVATAGTVTAYFTQPSFKNSLDNLGKLQAQGGLLFVFFAGFVAGGILPEIAKIATRKSGKFDKQWISNMAYVGFIYGVVALLVYYLYIILAAAFGTSLSFKTTAIKVLIDMFIFSPFLSIPFATGMLIWRREKFKVSAWIKVIHPKLYQVHVLPGMLLCWAFWFPVLSAVYCLPLQLQFPIAILCEAAWSILFVFSVGATHDPPVLVE